MNSALRKSLSDEQYQKLVCAALARYKAIQGEAERSKLDEDLKRYEKRAEGDYSDRTTPGGGNPIKKIFAIKNETLGIIRSVKRFLLARICKDLFGGEPIFYVHPEGRLDKVLAEGIQKHAGWKLRQANYKAKIKRAIDVLLDVGYVPIKTTWDVQEDVSESLQTILVHKEDGTPVLTRDGDYLYDDDETFDPTAQSAEQGDEGQPVAESAKPQAAVTAFVKAPEVILDASKYSWKEHLIEERVSLYKGLRIDSCERKDVFWPINVADLEEADMTGHRFDSRLSELRAKYAEKTEPGSNDEQETDSDRTPAKPDSEVADILDSLKNESATPKSEAGKPTEKEAEASGQDEDPLILTAECSFDFDCFGDGIRRRLHLVLLPDQEECIYAEYRMVLAPRAAKNIHLLSINRRPNRAYGRGLYEVYENLADAADELLNGILQRNQYVANPQKVWNPENTKEGQADPELKYDPDTTYTARGAQTDPKSILFPIVLPDLDQRTWQLMELFMQLIQLDSGVTNANQGDVSNLPSNSTATGINSMLESSSVLHQYILEEIRDCLTPQLSFAIGLIYLKQDTDETFDYLEADSDDEAAKQVMQLKDARKLRHLPMDVDILLTRTKRQEQREAAMAAIPIGVQYGQLPPPDQARMRDAFVQFFRSLDFDNPEDFFPAPDLNVPPPEPPPPKATESIALKGADLTATQKDALAQKLGLPAALPHELAPPAEQTGAQAGTPGGPPPAAPSADADAPLPTNVLPDTTPTEGVA